MVEKGDKIEYKILKKEPIIEPDNPDYIWDELDYKPDKEEIINRWHERVKFQFETWDQHKKSDLFRRYRDYEEDNRTMDLPTGMDGFENGNPVSQDLLDALTYRVNNYNKASKSGWKVFNDLCGDYELTIVDNGVLIDRQRIMTKWLKWINEAPELTAIDPLTNDIVKGLPENDSKIIYYFPQGLSDTTLLHYKVFEEVKGARIIEDTFTKNVSDAATYFALLQIEKYGDIKNPMSIMGPMMQIPIFAGQHEIIKSILDEAIELANILFEGGNKMDGSIIEYFKNKVPTYGVATLEEKTKEIAPRKLLNRVTDEPLLIKLQANRPPASKKDNGGRLWPKYKGGKFLLRFTNEAFDMLTKATGRKWGWPSESCETWNGCFGRGPCSDIKYGNCIIWIFEMGDDKIYPEDYIQWNHDEIGRLIVRWGEGMDAEAEPVGIKVGIEPGAYPKQAAWTKNMIKAVALILKDAGLFNYETCRTPYRFMGYSDYAHEGRTRINYRGLTYRDAHGNSIDLTLDDVDLYLLMANDPLLTKFQASDVLELGSEPSKMALAQNQAVWAMPDKIRGLVRWGEQSGMVEEVINFLLQHEVIHPDLVATWTENLPAYAPNYRIIDSMSNIVYTIMNHPMLNNELQRRLRANHNGFVDGGEFVGTFDEIMYLQLNKVRLFGNDNHIPLVKAPSDILDSMVNMVIAGDFSDSSRRRELQNGGTEMEIKYSPKEIKDLYWDNYDYLQSMYALISAPNLSPQSHMKLLQSFGKWYVNNWSGLETIDENEHVNAQIQKVVHAIQSSVIYPLREPSDWGYHATPLNISYNEWPKEWRGQKEDKQNLYSVRLLLNSHYGFAISMDLLMCNIRSHKVYQYLWQNRKKLDIDPIKFTMDMQNRKYGSNIPTKNKWLTSSIFMKAIAYKPKKVEVDLLGWRNLPSLKYSFDNKQFPLGQEVNQVIRTTIPQGVIQRILTKHPQIIDIIGLEIIATWLNTPDEFYMFETYVFQKALGDKFIRKPRTFLDYPEPSSPEEWLKWSNFIENLSCLQNAACGGDYGEGGLSTNISLPKIQQLQLLTKEGSSKWRDISDKYGGNYESYLIMVVMNLLKNPNISKSSLKWILENYPEHEKEILKNPNVDASSLSKFMKLYPFEALKNTGLDSGILQKHMNYIFNTLLIDLPAINPNRFENHIIVNDDSVDKQLQEYIKTSNALHRWLSLYKNGLERFDWLRFWRGGTHRKRLNLPNRQNLAPLSSSTEMPMAMVDEPIIIDSPHIIYTIDIEEVPLEEGEIGYEITQLETRHIEEIKILENGKIKVKGKKRPSRRFRQFEETYQDAADMYGWIPPDERGANGDKWKHSIVLVSTDELWDEEEREMIPIWRGVELTHEEINEFSAQVLNHPNITDDIIINMVRNHIQNENKRIRYGEGSAYRISVRTLFSIIDSLDKWSPKIIKEFSLFLLNARGDIAIMGYNNVKPTNLMREIAMGDNEKMMEEYGFDDAYALNNFREWMLRIFKDTIPIDFVYLMISDFDVSDEVRDRAMQVRNSRIREFLEYLHTLSENEVIEEMVME
tara:strand:+ start:12559 stop:17205 length:4647 start_codon:yes stop_codon:yes gene_type:complete